MIIVSQDKLLTTESLELEICNYQIKETEDGRVLCFSQIKETKSNRIFGKYETEERAKAILEDIINFYIRNEMQNKVYRMPEE